MQCLGLSFKFELYLLLKGSIVILSVLEGEDSGEEDDQGRKLKKPKPADGMSPDTRGDEDEIMSEQIFGDEEEEKIPDDFYYEFEEHVSKPAISDESGLPSDVLTLTYPFEKYKANIFQLFWLSSSSLSCLLYSSYLQNSIKFKPKWKFVKRLLR